MKAVILELEDDTSSTQLTIKYSSGIEEVRQLRIKIVLKKKKRHENGEIGT